MNKKLLILLSIIALQNVCVKTSDSEDVIETFTSAAEGDTTTKQTFQEILTAIKIALLPDNSTADASAAMTGSGVAQEIDTKLKRKKKGPQHAHNVKLSPEAQQFVNAAANDLLWLLDDREAEAEAATQKAKSQPSKTITTKKKWDQKRQEETQRQQAQKNKDQKAKNNARKDRAKTRRPSSNQESTQASAGANKKALTVAEKALLGHNPAGKNGW